MHATFAHDLDQDSTKFHMWANPKFSKMYPNQEGREKERFRRMNE